MSDKQIAIDAVLNFLNDDTKRILLVRGYDNDAKLRVILSCLDSVFEKGIIRTSSMSSISEFINGAFNKKLLPTTVLSTTTYKLGRMKVAINSYATSTQNNPKGNENCFTLFFPVQTVLDNKKRYQSFLRNLITRILRKSYWSLLMSGV